MDLAKKKKLENDNVHKNIRLYMTHHTPFVTVVINYTNVTIPVPSHFSCSLLSLFFFSGRKGVGITSGYWT